MNLIIEAGGTKSNLAFVEKGQIMVSYTEPGLQFSRESLEDLEKKIVRWNSFHAGPIQRIYLFAAGIGKGKKVEGVKKILEKIFHTDQVFLHSDLLAACYATAGNQPGIIGILGTGSNSCYYNGSDIILHVPPGGFILGDEGSGAYLGKQLLIDYLRSDMPVDVKQQLEQEKTLSAELVIQQVYGGSTKDAANFCSGFAPFIINRLEDAYCYQLCKKAMSVYIDLVEKNYGQHSNQLYLVGSIAFYLQDILKAEARLKHIEIVKLIQHPAQDLSLFLSARDQL